MFCRDSGGSASQEISIRRSQEKSRRDSSNFDIISTSLLLVHLLFFCFSGLNRCFNLFYFYFSVLTLLSHSRWRDRQTQLSMPFSTTPHASSAQAHLGSMEPSDISRDYVSQSRETGGVVPAPSAKSIADDDSRPKPKPFAHFLAGGYVT